MASIRHTVRVRPDVVRIVHVAKPDCFLTILRTFIRHISWRRAYCAHRETLCRRRRV